MTVYIEYAFFENLLLDGALLWLAFRATKTPLRFWRLLFAATVGGTFALVFPLLYLPLTLRTLLKICMGALLPMLCTKRLTNKKEWGRYGLNTLLFFFFTFFFGGGLTAIGENFTGKRLPAFVALAGFLLLLGISLVLIEKTYKRRGIYRHIYPCEVIFRDKRQKLSAFYDSGNLATKNALPVCFLSAEIFYDLFEEILFSPEEGEQMRSELCVSTLSGEKKLSLYKGGLRIEKEGENLAVDEVYFACATNMISKGYKLILHSRIFDGKEGEL